MIKPACCLLNSYDEQYFTFYPFLFVAIERTFLVCVDLFFCFVLHRNAPEAKCCLIKYVNI